MLKKLILFIALFSSLLFSEGRVIPLSQLYLTPLEIKDKMFHLWLALNPLQHTEGLSFVSSDAVPHRYGMLFIYPENQERTFWMKDTFLDLDIAFIKESGEVSDVYSMERDSYEFFSSTEEVRYVLELRRGVFKEIALKAGDKIQLPRVISDFSKP